MSAYCVKGKELLLDLKVTGPLLAIAAAGEKSSPKRRVSLEELRLLSLPLLRAAESMICSISFLTWLLFSRTEVGLAASARRGRHSHHFERSGRDPPKARGRHCEQRQRRASKSPEDLRLLFPSVSVSE